METVSTRISHTSSTGPSLPVVEQPHRASFASPLSLWPDFMVGQEDNPVRVVVVNGDPRMRRVISQELMSDMRTVVVGEAGTLREGRKQAREHEFDVMLVDLSLADGSGYDLISYVKNAPSPAEVVVVSVLNTDEDAMRAFELGAAGFLVKNSWFGNYVQAVLQVANGGAAITPSLARRLLLKLDRNRFAASGLLADSRVPGRLSDREKEILRLIANGFTSVEIGSRLTISDMTVNSHVRNIYRKLHVRTRAQAVSCANNWGFL